MNSKICFQICAQLMRHSKRKRLSTEDVERALKWYDAPPTLGHQFNEADPSYVQVPDVGRRLSNGETIYAPDEQVIDLHDFSLKPEAHENLEHLSCEATWVSLEGNLVEDTLMNFPESSHQYYQALTGVILNDTTADIRVM